MPLHHETIRSIHSRHERGQSIAVIASQLSIRRSDVREVLGPISRPMFTSEMLPGIRQMSDADAMLCKNAHSALSDTDEERLNGVVWSIAAEIRASNLAKSRGEVANA